MYVDSRSREVGRQVGRQVGEWVGGWVGEGRQRERKGLEEGEVEYISDVGLGF